ncbi:MAG: hypothetical protein IBJ03_16860 [Gemmatimonadaceae bacterium]|nr:hypothetical protein [Gemmatimonadaceae bacterium]
MKLLPYYASAHIYCLDLDPSPYHSSWDDLIQQLVRPLIEDNTVLGFFFVRYRDPRAHLRLRVRLSPATPSWLVRNHLRKRLATMGLRERPRNDQGSAQTTSQRWFEWAPYQREVERYGGLDCLAHIEAIFETTARIALDVMRFRQGKSEAMVLAEAGQLACMLVSVFATDTRHMADTFRRGTYGAPGNPSGTSPIIDPLLRERLRDAIQIEQLHALAIPPTSTRFDSPPTSRHAVYAEHYARLESIATQLRSTRSTDEHLAETLAQRLPSLVHMLWNRLGLTRWHEHILASALISQCYPHDQSVSIELNASSI